MQDLSQQSIDQIKKHTAPNGRTFTVEYDVGVPSMYRIKYADDKKGELPEKLNNHLFTKRTLAYFYLESYLAHCWRDAESRMTPSQRKAASA